MKNTKLHCVGEISKSGDSVKVSMVLRQSEPELHFGKMIATFQPVIFRDKSKTFWEMENELLKMTGASEIVWENSEL